jgi:hypothetical protein
MKYENEKDLMSKDGWNRTNGHRRSFPRSYTGEGAAFTHRSKPFKQTAPFYICRIDKKPNTRLKYVQTLGFI